MPIDYSEYPPNWKTEIRPAVLERAKDCCEWCGVKNKALIHRFGKGKDEWEYWPEGMESEAWDVDGKKATKIILTIAHLDHDKINHDVKLERLAALCQKCHLGHDLKHHVNNRKYGRNHNKNNMKLDLFPQEEDNGAEFSHDRTHRYSLWRIWDKSKPLVMFIGLNPSTANESEADPTIESVIRISKYNGYGGFYMMNCWTYITADPKLLKHNPASDEWNNNLLTVISGKCADVVFAWGAFKIITIKGRDKELIEMFPNAKALMKNKNGSPKHPLFTREKTKLIPYHE